MNIVKIIIDKWYVLAGFTLLGVLIGIATQEDRYESDASLMFKLGREHLYQPEFGNRQPIASTRSDLANAINTETHIMSSAAVLVAAVRDIGAVKILGELSYSDDVSAELLEQSAVDRLSADLSVRAVDGTNVLQLRFSHEIPEVARDTLSAVVSAFLQYRKEIYGDSSLLLMQEKLTENQSALLIAEAELQKFSTKNNIYSYEDQLQSITQQLIEADRNRQNLSVEMSEVESQLQLNSERIGTTAASISLYTDTATNTLYDDAKSRIFELQMERNQLRGKYRDNSGRVTQLLSEIAQLEKFIKTQNKFTTRSERMGRNPALDSLVSRKIELENKLDTIVGRQNSYADLISSLQRNRNALNAVRAEYEKKKSAVDVLKERQLVYVDEVEKAELSLDINNTVRSGARILQNASLPTIQSGITGMARARLSGLVGLLFAIAFLIGRSVVKTLNVFPASGTKTGIERDIDLDIDRNREAGRSAEMPSLQSNISNQIVENSAKINVATNESGANEIGGIKVLGKIARA